MEKKTADPIAAMQMCNRIESLMRANKIKCGMLGIIIEKCPQTVSKRLQHPETFTVDELIKIARFFHVELRDLCGVRV